MVRSAGSICRMGEFETFPHQTARWMTTLDETAVKLYLQERMPVYNYHGNRTPICAAIVRSSSWMFRSSFSSTTPYMTAPTLLHRIRGRQQRLETRRVPCCSRIHMSDRYPPCAKYIVLIKLMIVSAIVVVSDIRLWRRMDSMRMTRENSVFDLVTGF